MKNWSIPVVSVLLACFVWLVHVLSLDYSAYLQYRIRLVTSLDGYASSAVAEETLFARGKASGFYIMRARGINGKLEELSIEADPDLLIPVPGEDGIYVIEVQDIREKIEECLGDHFDIDYFDEESLTFSFERQNCRLVPVVLVTDITVKEQYMQVGGISLTPDSVLVYGPASELEAVTEVRTLPVIRYGLDDNAQGYAQLEKIRGMRLGVERVRYDVKVDRYVEMKKTLPISVVNVPLGKSVVLIPSEASLACRIAFGLRSEPVFNALSLEIDYRDVASSLNAKVIPGVKGLSPDVYTYDITPGVVECILLEKK